MSADDPATDRELLLQMNTKLDTLVGCSKDHEDRLRTLENSFWKVIGLASVISFIAGWIGSRFPGGGN